MKKKVLLWTLIVALLCSGCGSEKNSLAGNNTADEVVAGINGTISLGDSFKLKKVDTDRKGEKLTPEDMTSLCAYRSAAGIEIAVQSAPDREGKKYLANEIVLIFDNSKVDGSKAEQLLTDTLKGMKIKTDGKIISKLNINDKEGVSVSSAELGDGTFAYKVSVNNMKIRENKSGMTLTYVFVSCGKLEEEDVVRSVNDYAWKMLRRLDHNDVIKI